VGTARRLDPARATVASSSRWRLACLLLGLVPLIVVVAEHRVALVPVLLVPVLAVDLATRRAIQAERQRELARQEQAAAEAMVATVSHELRAPLTVVLGSLETLLRREGALEVGDRRELVAMAARQGRRLQRLVEQLLLTARLEHGAVEQGRGAVIDAVTVMREAGTAIELCHPGRRVQLEPGGVLPVRATPDALLQVLTNLLDNAAKYSPNGTPIRLEACRRGVQAVIAVEDAGPGVPTAERERIFERFSQLDSSAGRRAGGVGLGLYIARQLARAQGGDLVLAGHRGARFELRLPLAVEDAPLAQRDAPLAQRDRQVARAHRQ
jgi:two-component system OmpR family sensor kinase